MSVHAGPADWWTNTTQDGQNYLATKAIAQSGIILNYDAGLTTSYPGSGTSWTDLSSTANTGTLVNGPTFSSSNGGIVNFDGVNDYMSLTANPSITNTFTMEIWVKCNNPVDNRWVFGREQCYRMLYTSNGVNFTVATSNNSWYSAGTSIGVLATPTNFNHVVWVYDGTKLLGYLNSILATTGSAISGNIVSNGYNFYFCNDNDSGAADIYFGDINVGNFKIYNRALSASEVRTNFNVYRQRFLL